MLSTLSRSAPRFVSAIIKTSATTLPRPSIVRPLPQSRLARAAPIRAFHQTPPRASMSVAEYAKLSDETMETLYEALDNWCELNDGVDVDYSNGVLTLTTPAGTYIINKQPPNKQIWLSSPVSGPFQYGFNAKTREWVDIRGSGGTLRGLMEREISVGLF